MYVPCSVGVCRSCTASLLCRTGLVAGSPFTAAPPPPAPLATPSLPGDDILAGVRLPSLPTWETTKIIHE
jgi:hypothetical protein